MVQDLLLYQYPVELLYVGNRNLCRSLENSPMNKRKIKIHKGTDNQIKFRVFDQDRKCVSVRHMWVSATLVTSFAETREKVFQKPCKVGFSQKGVFYLFVEEGDLVDVAPGHYQMIITAGEQLATGEPDEIISKPFYVDMEENIKLDVEIIEAADSTPVESSVISWDRWTATGMDDFEQDRSQSAPFNRYNTGFVKYYTEAISGSRIKNRINATHTFSLCGENLSGTLRVLATLDEIPQPDPNNYFFVNITSAHNEITFDEWTGTDAWTFSGNFMWLKFEFLPDYSKGDEWGSVKKLIVRS